MKIVASFLLSLTAYSAELIHISGDSTPENLEVLSAKYAQTLVVDTNNVYLIPKECQLERYFGGASQGELHLIHTQERTETLAPTQEVFEAKDTTVIEKKIEQEKAVLLVEGKVSKAFLDDTEGRGFGGESELPLDMSSQKDQVIVETLKNTVTNNPIAETSKSVQHPSCKLLDNGSGYQLYSATNLRFYSDREFIPIVNDTILFK
jgi:hypothetical protein